jgi:hypothetical protein
MIEGFVLPVESSYRGAGKNYGNSGQLVGRDGVGVDLPYFHGNETKPTVLEARNATTYVWGGGYRTGVTLAVYLKARGECRELTPEETEMHVRAVPLSHYHLLLFNHANPTYRLDPDLLVGSYDMWLRKSLHETHMFLAQRGLVGGSTIGEILQRAVRRNRTHNGPEMREGEVYLYRVLARQLTVRVPAGQERGFRREERCSSGEVARLAKIAPGSLSLWMSGHGGETRHLETAKRFKVG